MERPRQVNLPRRGNCSERGRVNIFSFRLFVFSLLPRWILKLFFYDFRYIPVSEGLLQDASVLLQRCFDICVGVCNFAPKVHIYMLLFKWDYFNMEEMMRNVKKIKLKRERKQQRIFTQVAQASHKEQWKWNKTRNFSFRHFEFSTCSVKPIIKWLGNLASHSNSMESSVCFILQAKFHAVLIRFIMKLSHELTLSLANRIRSGKSVAAKDFPWQWQCCCEQTYRGF